MESAALNRPPAWAERLVSFLTPPAAREAVLGDLCETYCSPSRYAAEALRTVPFVILSQMRRNANLPALALQAFLIFFVLGGFGATGPLPGAQALLPTVLVLLALLVRDAYQPARRQADRHAMVEAILVVPVMLLCALILTWNMQFFSHFKEDDLRWLRFGFMSPFIFPLLCLFRTGLIVEGDRRTPFLAEHLSEDVVLEDYRRFARRARWRSQLEALALGGAIALALLFGTRLHLPDPALLTGLLSLYGLAALFLMAEGGVRALPPCSDFLSLRALYQREMARQQQLRRFLWWLWLTPLLLVLHGELIQSGFAAHRPILVVSGTVAGLTLCFFIGALNREYGGRAREKANLLDRIPQT